MLLRICLLGVFFALGCFGETDPDSNDVNGGGDDHASVDGDYREDAGIQDAVIELSDSGVQQLAEVSDAGAQQEPQEPVGPFCGDGNVDPDEYCDDGNTDDGDYCSSNCQVVTGYCGDSTVQINEVCDDGNTSDGDYCRADCRYITGYCGDGAVQTNEACDDGNAVTEFCEAGEFSCEVCDETCQLIEGVLADGLACGPLGECIYVDRSTGLAWQGCPAGQSGEGCDGDVEYENYYDAALYCVNLSWAGFDDWILPDIDQLRSLIAGCPSVEYGSSECSITHECSYSDDYEDTCDEVYCPGCAANEGPRSDGCYYPADLPGECPRNRMTWSRSMAAPLPGDSRAYGVYFEYGSVSWSVAASGNNSTSVVRCVRLQP